MSVEGNSGDLKAEARHQSEVSPLAQIPIAAGANVGPGFCGDVTRGAPRPPVRVTT